MRLPRAAIYRVCLCIEARKTAKRKAESGQRAVKMPEEKSNQLVKATCDKKRVTSMKLAAKMNAERYFAERIVREAAVRTYKRIRRPGFRPELEQRQRRELRWKGQRQTRPPILAEPQRPIYRDGPSCCPVSSSYRIYLGCPQTGGWQGRLEPQNEEVLRRRIGKCLNDIGWNVIQSVMSTAKTNLRMAADTLLLTLQFLVDHGHTICKAFMHAWQLVFWCCAALSWKTSSFLSHFFVPKITCKWKKFWSVYVILVWFPTNLNESKQN